MDGLIMFNMVHHQHWPSAPMTWPVLTTTTHDHHGLPSQLCTTLAMMAAPKVAPGGCTSSSSLRMPWNMPFGGPQLWPLLGLLKQLKSPDKSRTFSPAPGFSRIFTNIFQIFSASEDQTHPAAEGHLDHLEPGGIHGPCWAMLDLLLVLGAEHKASCRKRDFASSTRPGGSTWDRRLIPWWSDEKYLENTKLLWLQWMASDFVDTRDHWNSGVRVERTKKTAEELTTKWVELQSTREVTDDRVHW